MYEDAKSVIDFNDIELARFMFGDNAQTGSVRLLIWMAGFVLVFGGMFILLR